VKAGLNDCQTATHSCAGTATAAPALSAAPLKV
ncbi:BufA1 family periplasmic bufferin-type metallophore, partial [Asticcacaulis taihuensis]